MAVVCQHENQVELVHTYTINTDSNLMMEEMGLALKKTVRLDCADLT